MASNHIGREAQHVTLPGGDWHASRTELEAIEARPCSGDDDADIDRAGELVADMLGSPAPDRAALLWKLDYLLAGEDGPKNVAPEYVAQTVADYRRFLGA